MSESFVVATPVFEGPSDRLLHLVTTHEIDILDIPLAPIVDAFLLYVAEAGLGADLVDMEALSEFLLVAAILLEIKSSRLLPGPDEIEDDEEVARFEERDLLLARLLECRAYAAAADAFVAMAEVASRSVPREVGLDEGLSVRAPDLLAGVVPEMLAQAYLRATAERPEPRVDLSHVTVDTVTVAETVQSLSQRLPELGNTSFRTITERCVTRMDVIVHFLALLELCKLGRVSLGQGETFGMLEISWIQVQGTPVLALVGADVEDYEG